MRFYCQTKEFNVCKKRLSSLKKGGGEKDFTGGRCAWLPFHLVTQWFSSAPRVALTRAAIPFLPGRAWIHPPVSSQPCAPTLLLLLRLPQVRVLRQQGGHPTMTLFTPSYSLSWWIVQIFPSKTLQKVNCSRVGVRTFSWKVEVLICICLGAGLQQILSLFPTSQEDCVVVVFL